MSNCIKCGNPQISEEVLCATCYDIIDSYTSYRVNYGYDVAMDKSSTELEELVFD